MIATDKQDLEKNKDGKQHGPDKRVAGTIPRNVMLAGASIGLFLVYDLIVLRMLPSFRDIDNARLVNNLFTMVWTYPVSESIGTLLECLWTDNTLFTLAKTKEISKDELLSLGSSSLSYGKLPKSVALRGLGISSAAGMGIVLGLLQLFKSNGNLANSIIAVKEYEMNPTVVTHPAVLEVSEYDNVVSYDGELMTNVNWLFSFLPSSEQTTRSLIQATDAEGGEWHVFAPTRKLIDDVYSATFNTVGVQVECMPWNKFPATITPSPTEPNTFNWAPSEPRFKGYVGNYSWRNLNNGTTFLGAPSIPMTSNSLSGWGRLRYFSFRQNNNWFQLQKFKMVSGLIFYGSMGGTQNPQAESVTAGNYRNVSGTICHYNVTLGKAILSASKSFSSPDNTVSVTWENQTARTFNERDPTNLLVQYLLNGGDRVHDASRTSIVDQVVHGRVGYMSQITSTVQDMKLVTLRLLTAYEQLIPSARSEDAAIRRVFDMYRITSSSIWVKIVLMLFLLAVPLGIAFWLHKNAVEEWGGKVEITCLDWRTLLEDPKWIAVSSPLVDEEKKYNVDLKEHDWYLSLQHVQSEEK